MSKVVGLIAGLGILPEVVADDARAKGYAVAAVAIEGLASETLAGRVDSIKRLNAGKIGGIIDFLKQSGAGEVVMAGKVPKGLLYSGGIRPDLRAAKMLFSLKDRSDDSIMLAITNELEKEGMRLLSMTDFCGGLLTPEGVLTKKAPSKGQWKDIEFGLRIVKEIGRLEIGQTVVVKDRAVMAVEAIEGTDETLLRGGRLAGGGGVAVKASRPAQDMRLDVPVVGLGTLEAMMEADIAVLALEAQKSVFLERDAFIKAADETGIKVVGVSGSF